MRPFALTLTLFFLAASSGFGDESSPLLLQKPAMNRDRIIFGHAGDLWVVGRGGGEASRLTSGVGLESGPVFSPDGSKIAFTGEYEGNLDVYLVDAGGGQPKRLTYHPGYDVALGWTPDGTRVLFRSGRTSSSRFDKLFTISTEGGLPSELPLPMGVEGSFSPDGSQIAYVPYWNRRPVPDAYIAWKHYRGGKTSPIWIARLSDSHIEKVPRDNSNDFNPMWVGEKLYFLSDRDGPVALYAFEAGSGRVEKLVSDEGHDIQSASAGPGAIVYEQLGSLSVYDLETGRNQKLDIQIKADFPNARPRFEKVARQIRSARISPTGQRAVFGARGEVLTVPAEKGDVRNLTATPGVAERDPAWSPDGKQIAFFSDVSGEYALHLAQQDGTGEVRAIDLGRPASFFYEPIWSPDSKKIAYTDKRLNVWYIDLEKGTPVKIDSNTYDTPIRALDPSWSPDSRWIVYTKQLPSHMRAVFVYSLETGKTHQITDGLSDARFAAFDKNGKYLYFTASTDVGPTTGWLDMSSMHRPVTRSVYVVVLAKDEPSPLRPESDEEKDTSANDDEDKDTLKDEESHKGDKKKKETPVEPVKLDLDEIDQRILALPIPPRDYAGLAVGKPGILFLEEAPPGPGPEDENDAGTMVHKFDLKTRKTEKVLDGVRSLEISRNGEKMLYRKADAWFIVSTSQPPKPGEGSLKLDAIEVRVDPRAEWRQMYHEVWRIQRDFLYDPNAHGLDLEAAEKAYEPFLEGISSRADLNYLFHDMLGEIVLGHTHIVGGDSPEVRNVPGGLLGADYTVENGRYRFDRIYRGENWNPDLKAPLTQPGVNVKEGDYLLAINGRDLQAPDTPFSLMENTAGKSVVLKVGSRADGTGAREVTVVPIASETSLRNRAWIDANRRKVDELSGGRVAYLYLPDTALGGFTSFNRYYFAQIDRQGAVVDERFNGGGSAADYIVDYLHRPLLNYWTTREGNDFRTPLGSIFGPKAMIINAFAGSGGDALPWYFRKAKVGPLIGTRTWGGLVGIYDYPELIDGGRVTAPRLAFWNPDEGTWDVENHGVAPDIEVELDPELVRKGHDPQLEKAVEVVLREIAKNPPKTPKRPEYPDYHKNQSAAPAVGEH